MGKYVPYNGLIQIVRDKKDDGRKIVVVPGCFDMLHSGHIHFFQDLMKDGYKRENGYLLIAGVNNDKWVRKKKGKDRPYLPHMYRVHDVAALEAVAYSYVIPGVGEFPGLQSSRHLRPNTFVRKVFKIITKLKSGEIKYEIDEERLEVFNRELERLNDYLGYPIDIHEYDVELRGIKVPETRVPERKSRKGNVKDIKVQPPLSTTSLVEKVILPRV